MTSFLNDPGLARCFDDLESAVRNGGIAHGTGSIVAAENPVWVEFARAMLPTARAFAPGVADAACRAGSPRLVLDVAAGHGLYGIEVAKRAPESTVVFQDWKNVLAAALAPGGRVAVLEFVLEENRVTPARSAAFD